MTLLFTVAFAIGLVALSFVAIGFDSRLRADRLDARLRLAVQSAERYVYIDDLGVLDVESLASDSTLAGGDPDLFVVATLEPSGEGEPTVVFSSERPFVVGLDLVQIAKSVIEAEDELNTDEPANGRSVRVLALPLYDEHRVRGAVIGVADPGSGRADHRRLAAVVWSASVLLVLGSAVAGYVLSGRSIRPAARALEQQEQFLADAAHELRTPVAALRAVTESGIAGDEQPLVALDRAGAIITRMGGLLDDLLLLARMDADRQPVHREPLRLDLLVEEVLAEHPDVQLDAEAVVVQGDPQLLRRLVSNLIDNAVRHGRSLNPTAAIEVAVRPRTLVVADRGPGIDPSLEGALFGRFRSGRHSGGAGLGLAIAAWIAQAHGGRISGENRPGGGTQFTVYLPD